MPSPGTSPTVGRNPTMPCVLDGLMIEPAVSVPIPSIPSADAIDKFYAEIEALHVKQPLFGEVFGSVTEGPEHRDHLLRVLDSGHK